MDFIELELRPGLYRAGTERQSKGRYYDASLCRWYAGRLGPIGGWRVISPVTQEDMDYLEWVDGEYLMWVDGEYILWSDDETTIDGIARTILTWRDNSNQAWAGIGTNLHLYAMTVGGVMHDITPSGFTVGREDSVYAGGYGGGLYGAGTYGTARLSQTVLQEATSWTLDIWGQYLLGCAGDDSPIYQWELDTGVVAAAVANAPTAEAVVVTGENFTVALGADGNPRKAQWSDQGDNTVWTPSSTNQAGDLDLVTNGRLRCGKRVRGGTLLFTDVDVHLMTFVGGQLVYGIERVASGCGVASKQAVAVVDSTAYWMGKDGFWMYNGYVQPLPCDIQDSVFTDKTTDPYRINRSQSAKVSAVHISAFGEIWWLYPSDEELECNRAAVFNYREGTWTSHVIDRTCGTNRDAFAQPLMVGSNGYVYEHEIGVDHEGSTIFAESGPVELGSGYNVIQARQLVPDEETEGECSTYFKTKAYPAADEETFGPYTSSQPTSVRFGGRWVRVRYEQTADAVWRIGKPRLEIRAAGRR